MRLLWTILASAAGAYALFLGAAAAVFHLPPERSAAVIAATPRPLMAIVPFERLWTFARAGSLQVAEPAPDFDLETYDRTARVRLADFRGRRPVVLVFGSYT